MSASPSQPINQGQTFNDGEEVVAAHDEVPDDWEDAPEGETDDDDMEYIPIADEMDEENGGEDEYEDASEDLSGLEIEFALRGDEEGDAEEEGEDGEEDDDEDDAGTETEGQTPATHPVFVTRDQILRLLGHRGLRDMLSSRVGAQLFTAEDSDEEMDRAEHSWGRRRRAARQAVEFEKVPSEEGQKLMTSGTFGANERPMDSLKRKKKLASRLLRREMGLGSHGRQRARSGLLKQDLIPSSIADRIIHYNNRCYSGQFSNDGNFFFSCGQDFKVRMYDTSNPYDWHYYKVVDNPYGQWTITDASLSPDNKFLAYSSISRIVCLAPTDPNDNSTPRTLDFSRTDPRGGAGPGNRMGYSHWGIWSIRFSGDGREIVAGTGDRSVYVFDIERNMSILRIPGHQDDVNAVCFGDQNSPHILYSGSDDTTLKVWDRRSMGDGRAAGVFLGHTEGLTYVDSKGDGRYIVSNGKDQTAKLWDLRKVISTEAAEKIGINRFISGFDYRMNPYSFGDWRPHPHDCSLVTFRGHQVLKTLIRCHFSPPGSTDSRYVYSGSYNGKVYVWNLDASIKAVIDVAKATQHLRSRHRRGYEDDGFYGQEGFQTCVRDASWHPDVPMIAATSWNGWGTALGTCTVHSWNDGVDSDEAEPEMGLRVNAKLEPEVREEADPNYSGRRSRAAVYGRGR